MGDRCEVKITLVSKTRHDIELEDFVEISQNDIKQLESMSINGINQYNQEFYVNMPHVIDKLDYSRNYTVRLEVFHVNPLTVTRYDVKNSMIEKQANNTVKFIVVPESGVTMEEM